MKKKMKVAAVVAVFAVTVCFSWQICSITTSAAETERAAGESVHSYRHTENIVLTRTVIRSTKLFSVTATKQPTPFCIKAIFPPVRNSDSRLLSGCR